MKNLLEENLYGAMPPAPFVCIDNQGAQWEIFDTICNNDNLYVILTPENPQINKIRDDLLNLQRIIDRKRKEAEKD